jgi:transcription elongation factor GreA
MTRIKLEKLYSRLKEEVEKAESTAQKSRQSSNEASGALGASYSAAGDAEHSHNTALLSQQKFEQLKNLKVEIESAKDSETPTNVIPPSFISVKFTDGRESEFYFVKNPAYISGLNLVSPDSLIGKAILGKNVGETFSYTTGEQKFEGKILNIG